MTFPILSIIVFTPIVAGVIILLLPAERKGWIRGVALLASAVALLLSVVAYFSYDIPQGGYQMVQKIPWLPAWGISYHVGVDGLSLPLVLLTGVVMFTGVLISWGVDDRPREFFGFLFILATGVFGVFVSLDLFQLFFFYEIAVFPMYLLIAIWGWQKTREYAAMKLTLYLFIGSVVALVGALAMFFASGLHTFDMLELERAGFSGAFQRIWFPVVFFGFGVLGGLFPFHNWSPDGHVAAPTAVSMFHAGVLMKLGAFAALRVGIMLLPEGAKVHLPWIIFLALVNVVYGALIAMVQTDFKYVIGFSSVSHMGLVMLGFASLSREGYIGSGLQMFSHGVMTALFFAVVGMVYDRAHTRDIPKLGGFARKMPVVAIAFIVGGLVSMGMPGLSGFVAEFPIFLGVWSAQPIVAIIAALGIVVTAAYIMIIVRRVFFGPMPEEFEGHVGDVTPLDKLALGVLSFILIALGVFPAWMAPLVASGVNSVMRLLGGA
ncbi:MAG TPA: NADH-quinone oxidoreductase subunit M [Anaerolineales bacterium]|nr:NADH-quinone oxidoreductase subunit M [Anaerolineales bacterium]